jgi:uncharacterized membrane protein
MDVLIIHAAATWFMTGLIWFVQVVHYPLMAMAERATWQEFESRHQQRTTLIVGPAMCAESVSCIALWALHPEASGGGQWWILAGATGALIVAWISTFAVQVPLHARLSRAFSDRTHRLLVRTNWVRTAAWTCRAVFAGMLLLVR